MTITKKTITKGKTKGKTAEEMAAKQRNIGVAEFFARNKHLLGFDNPRKALLTTIKEAVDNSLDACEEANILPELNIQVIDMSKDRFRVIIEDNGPGIVKKQVPKIFGKLLYGSKFHSRRQQRGQQGIGISAAVMYGQLTTGRYARITSKVKGQKARYFELQLDTKTNDPDIIKNEEKEWYKEHGTRIELDIEGAYQKGAQSIDEYLKETAVVNPHCMIIYTNPKAEQIIFPRVTEKMPKEAKEIKPHPKGVEFGTMLELLSSTKEKTITKFLENEFVRVSSTVAKEICENSRILPKTNPKTLSRDTVESLIAGIKQTKIMAPPTDCLSPITAELLEKGLKKEVNAEFYASTTRDPLVYKGNPFQIEVAIAYGGAQLKDKAMNLMRFANRVPLLYQQGGCGITKGVVGVNWRAYGLNQSNGNMPVGPLTVVVHIASIWVPFTSESKEAIAQYGDIINEIKKALQEVGRQLSKYVAKKKKVKTELKKRSYIEKYIPKLAEGLIEILEEGKAEQELINEKLFSLLEEHRGKLDTMEFDPSKNEEYDDSWAKIGREEAKKELKEEFEEESGEKVDSVDSKVVPKVNSKVLSKKKKVIKKKEQQKTLVDGD